MKLICALGLLIFSFTALAQERASYAVTPGLFHRKGKVIIEVIPDLAKYRVQISFEVKKKLLVPVPDKLLKGKTIYEFPSEFKTEIGYQLLERRKNIIMPKALLKFVKRADYRGLKAAYYLEVLPFNQKSKIDIIYHPSLPATGWSRVKITLLSRIPLVNGYELQAQLKN